MIQTTPAIEAIDAAIHSVEQVIKGSKYEVKERRVSCVNGETKISFLVESSTRRGWIMFGKGIFDAATIDLLLAENYREPVSA